MKNPRPRSDTWRLHGFGGGPGITVFSLSATMNSVHEQQKSKNFERLNAEVDALKGQISELRQVTARLEGEASANKERITDLTTERDRLLSMLEAGPVKGAGFWSRLFGRG